MSNVDGRRFPQYRPSTVAAVAGRPPRPRGRVRLPQPAPRPMRSLARRLLVIVVAVFVMAVAVYAGRDGYADSAGGSVSFLDALYYATVSLSTTGYGDITPVTAAARTVNILLVTPLRILFLVILVGTTFEILAERTKEQMRLSHWRSHVRDHTVIIGYGTKGRSAATTLLRHGVRREDVVVVDTDSDVVAEANSAGFAGIIGDATRSAVLEQSEIDSARYVVVAPRRDDTAVLVTLTARQLNPDAAIVAATREDENVALLRQSGANTVITSAATAGRLLGIATLSTTISDVLEDLLALGKGLDIDERQVSDGEVGSSPRRNPDLVLAVVRGDEAHRFDDPQVQELVRGDRLVIIRGRAASAQGTD